MFNSFIHNFPKKDDKDIRKCYSCRWYEGPTGELPMMCKDCVHCGEQKSALVYDNYEEEK